jgi:hypothetical protein
LLVEQKAVAALVLEALDITAQRVRPQVVRIVAVGVGVEIAQIRFS